jgi:hypothetical protein
MTWYVVRCEGAAIADKSEECGVSVLVRLGEVCEIVSTGGELIVSVSAVGVSVAVTAGELWETILAGGESLVLASVVAVSVVTPAEV